MHELGHIGLRLSPASELDSLGDGAEAFLDARMRGGVNPKHPRGCRRGGDAVGVLDRELRLASCWGPRESVSGHAPLR